MATKAMPAIVCKMGLRRPVPGMEKDSPPKTTELKEKIMKTEEKKIYFSELQTAKLLIRGEYQSQACQYQDNGYPPVKYVD